MSKNHKKMMVKGGGDNAYGQPDRKISVFFAFPKGTHRVQWHCDDFQMSIIDEPFLVEPASLWYEIEMG